jgi:hypothetical protein
LRSYKDDRVAEKPNISMQTDEHHRYGIKCNLGISITTDLTLRAMEQVVQRRACCKKLDIEAVNNLYDGFAQRLSEGLHH